QNLPAGKYLVADFGGASNGPPAYTQLLVSSASASGSLPSAPATVTAAANGKDKYKWELSGAPLATGQNRIRFASKGKATLHLVGAFRIVGNASRQQMINFLKSNSNGPPPKFVDVTSFDATAALDGGRSQVSVRVPASRDGTPSRSSYATQPVCRIVRSPRPPLPRSGCPPRTVSRPRNGAPLHPWRRRWPSCRCV